jgi:hypothetical protein
VFADVVHSMDIAATLGPERLREIMANLPGRQHSVSRATSSGLKKCNDRTAEPPRGTQVTDVATDVAPAACRIYLSL